MKLDFQPINLSMKPMVEKYREHWDMDSSEYTFTNLLMWGTDGHILLEEYGDTLFCLLRYDQEAPFMFAPLPLNENTDYERSVHIAGEYMKNLGTEPRFSAVTGHLAELFRARCADYELKEDRANFDYVYRTEELLTLSGKKFHAKKNHLNQFRDKYAFEYVELRPEMLEECLEVYANWLNGKEVVEPSALGELAAIKTIITNMDALGVRGGGIRMEGKLTAFTLGELMRPDTALIHIEKAVGSIRGLFTIINQQFIEHEWKDTLYINREEDMGLEGMRRAKMSYHPIRMVEKFEATKRV